MLDSDPNPYQALARVLALRPPARRRLLRVEVWCEKSKCTPIRVYALRDGLLVHCRSDANVEDMRDRWPHLAEWSPRRACADEWISTGLGSPLQVVCDCDQTHPRLVDVARLIDLVPDDAAPARRTRLDVLGQDVGDTRFRVVDMKKTSGCGGDVHVFTNRRSSCPTVMRV